MSPHPDEVAAPHAVRRRLPVDGPSPAGGKPETASRPAGEDGEPAAASATEEPTRSGTPGAISRPAEEDDVPVAVSATREPIRDEALEAISQPAEEEGEPAAVSATGESIRDEALESISQPAEEPVAMSALEESIRDKTLEAWRRRVEGDLDEGLAKGLRVGCPELAEWTTPAVIRRMQRSGTDEAVVVGMLVQAVECRVRHRTLFQGLQCRVALDMRVIGRDLQGRPVIYMCMRNQQAKLGECLPQIYVCFEAAVKLCPDRASGQFVLVADAHHFTPSLNMDPPGIMELQSSVCSVFADRIHSSMVIDFSFIAQAAWYVLKNMLTESSREKICFLGEEKARTLMQERFDAQTCERVFSSLEKNRDPGLSQEERQSHAVRTSISSVPLGN